MSSRDEDRKREEKLIRKTKKDCKNKEKNNTQEENKNKNYPSTSKIKKDSCSEGKPNIFIERDNKINIKFKENEDCDQGSWTDQSESENKGTKERLKLTKKSTLINNKDEEMLNNLVLKSKDGAEKKLDECIVGKEKKIKRESFRDNEISDDVSRDIMSKKQLLKAKIETHRDQEKLQRCSLKQDQQERGYKAKVMKKVKKEKIKSLEMQLEGILKQTEKKKEFSKTVKFQDDLINMDDDIKKDDDKKIKETNNQEIETVFESIKEDLGERKEKETKKHSNKKEGQICLKKERKVLVMSPKRGEHLKKCNELQKQHEICKFQNEGERQKLSKLSFRKKIKYYLRKPRKNCATDIDNESQFSSEEKVRKIIKTHQRIKRKDKISQTADDKNYPKLIRFKTFTEWSSKRKRESDDEGPSTKRQRFEKNIQRSIIECLRSSFKIINIFILPGQKEKELCHIVFSVYIRSQMNDLGIVNLIVHFVLIFFLGLYWFRSLLAWASFLSFWYFNETLLIKMYGPQNDKLLKWIETVYEESSRKRDPAILKLMDKNGLSEYNVENMDKRLYSSRCCDWNEDKLAWLLNPSVAAVHTVLFVVFVSHSYIFFTTPSFKERLKGILPITYLINASFGLIMVLDTLFACFPIKLVYLILPFILFFAKFIFCYVLILFGFISTKWSSFAYDYNPDQYMEIDSEMFVTMMVVSIILWIFSIPRYLIVSLFNKQEQEQKPFIVEDHVHDEIHH